ncbi:DUF1651 domain-containing protein [Synechococcus sp. HB1133]|nr:DUF1651 domain-containing protein [Synechococcus sp. PH41509]MCB4423227.1 DUF1651 domain-containing protein [Synechococcus sp. HB1133]MCB4430715.1 DUF1651 domain-containing protein [Synechococcus sp. HBA1120]NHI82175.1 DUF1651 domain-containing protein [Synechococcus sp. HB1133]
MVQTPHFESTLPKRLTLTGAGKFLKYSLLLVLIKKLILRHNAIEALDNMLKTGWRRCRPPVR